MTRLTVAAVAFRDESGRLLTVRKQGTERFMLPGGKLEPGERPEDAAVREVREELALTLQVGELVLLGAWEAPAANEPGARVHGTVFTAELPGEPRPAAEIAELRWLPLDGGGGCVNPPADLAPLLTRYVVPALGGSVGVSRA